MERHWKERKAFWSAYLSRDVAARERDGDGNVITDEAPSRNPDSAGKYKQNIALATIGVQYSF